MIETIGGALVLLGGGMLSASSIALGRHPQRDRADLATIAEILNTAFPPPRPAPADFLQLLDRIG